MAVTVGTQTEFGPTSASVQSHTDLTVNLLDLNNVMTEEGAEQVFHDVPVTVTVVRPLELLS